MAIEEFPVACWTLESGDVIGVILGTELVVMESHPSRIRSAASECLAKAIKQGECLYSPEISSPQISFHTINALLSYRSDQGVYPLSAPSAFRIAAVHSRDPDKGFGECFLPFLQRSFYYYDEVQLKTLIEHFSLQVLNNVTPEEAYRYIMPSEPWLEVVSFDRGKVRPSQQQHNSAAMEYMLTVSDQAPLPKRVKRQVSRLPEVAWERGEMIQRLAEELLEGRSSCLLIGEQGVGKSVLWQEAVRVTARLSKSGESPLTFWRSTPQRIIAKAKYLGEWQEVCDEVVESLAQINGVLWLNDFISLLSIGGEGQEDSMAAYLRSYLAKGQIRIIGEMRPQELEAARNKLPGFLHLFEQINVTELSGRSAQRVVQAYANYAATNFAIDTRDDALETVSQLVRRYIKYERAPGNLVRFYHHCVKNAFEKKQATITRDQVIADFVAYTGLPELFLRDEQALSQEALLDYFKTRIIGQDSILEQLCRVIQIFKAGLNDPQKPIATLLFAGPTGVGKTAATKALADYFFSAGQSKNPLFRLDMSEFQHPGHIERLIGGEGKPSPLVQHVRANPFSVVLLDEIEKADDSVFDALLSTLDEGLLTDRFGRTTDFRNTIIIMTTNLGVNAGGGMGFSAAEKRGQVSLSGIRDFFRPEFINRIDAILCFNPLDRDSILSIARRELELLNQRERIREQKLNLSFSDDLVAHIAQAGFSELYGARPIQRAIEQRVVAELASFLVTREHTPSRIHLDAVDGAVVISAG
ncbi:AAA family ATPase [Hahella aquimaris]|uniref:AAA family ATPase n=1 Tax=Hahella sp. HNIBRBA332 TaxID=3015983 RepID=UPI00273A99D3|nr:AAA family ATPase [Hahella sp. HNIBRBA332]WLQ14426.1 AAA family ATPase [Hahella sp. HNIBRBA332]